jgi:hypothetical protein
MEKVALGFLILTTLLSACNGQIEAIPTNTPSSPSSDIDIARQVLIQYFEELNTGNFAVAAELYGGDLSELITWNADIDSNDPATLLQAACERQLQCLTIREITFATQTDLSNFEFMIEFSSADGTLFELGPCCGETATEMPPVSEFPCKVTKSQVGDFLVMCLPVYVP